MASAVDAIATNRGFWDTAKKVGNTYLNFSFGCGQDSKFVESIFKEKKSIAEAWHEAKLGESWWQSFKDAFTPSKMSEEWAQYGKEGAGALKKSGKFFLKRMPFIGNAIALLFEGPNIYRAFTDKEHGGGFFTGLTETAKAAAKFTAFAAGAALGGMVPVPGLNILTSMAGGMAANWLVEKIIGKSFTDQKEEAETEKAKKAQQSQQQGAQTPQTGRAQGTGGMSNPYGQGGSSNSIFQSDWKDKDLMAMSVGLA